MQINDDDDDDDDDENWSSIVTLVLSCPVSEILQVSVKLDPTPIPPEF